MDLDTAIENLELTRESILKVVSEIIAIDLEDNVIFEILEIKNILEDVE